MPEAPALQVTRLGVVVHPTREVRRTVDGLRRWAQDRDAELVQVGVHGRERAVAPRGEAEGCELVVAIGGDGTVLAGLRAAAPAGCPVLGVACGSLGALTAVDPSRLEAALAAVETGAWHERPVPALVATPEQGEPVRAFNDLGVVRAAGSQVSVEVELDGERFARWAGDGVVAATPFGSTAYTLALGGPLVAPGTAALVVTPVAPHGGNIPSLVAPAGVPLRLVVDGGYGGARVELDGRPVEFDVSSFTVALEAHVATLVRLDEGEGLFAGLRRRGLVTDSPRVLARDERAGAVTCET